MCLRLEGRHFRILVSHYHTSKWTEAHSHWDVWPWKLGGPTCLQRTNSHIDEDLNAHSSVSVSRVIHEPNQEAKGLSGKPTWKVTGWHSEVEKAFKWLDWWPFLRSKLSDTLQYSSNEVSVQSVSDWRDLEQTFLRPRSGQSFHVDCLASSITYTKRPSSFWIHGTNLNSVSDWYTFMLWSV